MLVITLLVIVVLAVAAVAFMQNTSTERQTARSQGSQYRAQLAAEAGASAAMATVADLITRYPDSVTVWQNIGGGAVNGTSNEATVLYARANGANSNVGASPAAFGGDVQLLAIPLVSPHQHTDHSEYIAGGSRLHRQQCARRQRRDDQPQCDQHSMDRTLHRQTHDHQRGNSGHGWPVDLRDKIRRSDQRHQPLRSPLCLLDR